MLQNPCKTLGFKKNLVYKIPPGGGGGCKPYPASGLYMKELNKLWILIPVSSSVEICVIKMKDKPMDYLQLSLIKHFLMYKAAYLLKHR